MFFQMRYFTHILMLLDLRVLLEWNWMKETKLRWSKDEDQSSLDPCEAAGRTNHPSHLLTIKPHWNQGLLNGAARRELYHRVPSRKRKPSEERAGTQGSCQPVAQRGAGCFLPPHRGLRLRLWPLLPCSSNTRLPRHFSATSWRSRTAESKWDAM